MKNTMISNGTVSATDFDYITLTDDIDQVVETMIKHREWKEKVKEQAEQENSSCP